MEVDNSIFTRNVEELIPRLTAQKVNLWRFLHKNFKENIHFIEIPSINTKRTEKRGGHNKNDILLTEEAFKLLENSFNLRNRNIVNISPNIKIVKLVLPIENQTLNFIENSYKNSVETIRQFIFDKYRVDMYFPKYKIILEGKEVNI